MPLGKILLPVGVLFTTVCSPESKFIKDEVTEREGVRGRRRGREGEREREREREITRERQAERGR